MKADGNDLPDSLGSKLAQAVAALAYEDLGPEVVRTLKYFTLDTLGVIGGAARAPGMAELLAAMADLESGGRARLLLNGSPASPAAAALANGAAAHALDFDDQHDPARVHAFCVVLPAVLATLPSAGGKVDGRGLLAALAVGVEVFCRLGLVCHNSLGKGWHPTTALGTLAAAVAAAKVMGLDARATLHALGLAFTQMSGTTQFIADGALAKRLGPGFAARSGVLAAHLARRGITGPWRFLEGQAGLFELYERGEVEPALLLEGWGSHWRLLELSMKPYPCCRCVHTVIQLALQCREQGIAAGDIVEGVIELGKVNRQIVGARFDRDHPNPVVHAQFNAAYAFATALVDGSVGIRSFTAEQVRREATAWASRLRTVDAGDIPPTAVPPARVTLTLASGRTVQVERWKMKGAPDDPMSEDEILAKFRAAMQWGVQPGEAALARLQGSVMALETLPDAGEVVERFLACRG
ncbi:MmgE/PrpD family protein [Bordetella genomosp. 10]|nr:MmgE/PrpD family protein [Bordetella genomosp. 10]